jgi:hypothetical protein
VREFNSVDGTFGTDDISNVRDGSTRGSTKVKDLLARSDVDIVNTTENTSGNLGSERIPDTVFDFSAISTFDGNSLFTVDGFTRNKVLGNEQIFLATSNEDTFVSVGFNDDFSSSTSTTSGTTTTATGSTTATTGGTTATSTSTTCKRKSRSNC